MNKYDLQVRKTARYFSLGTASPTVREVWFVCHGYAQLASEFLASFSALENEERLLIAPEGLHRFYAKGGSGKVAASWMTSEEREQDITDYINWLNAVSDDVLRQVPGQVRIVVVGFSQGAAAVSRWLSARHIQADELVLWCGFFPPDMQPATLPTDTRVTLVTASDDRFISAEQYQEQLKVLSTSKITFLHLPFEGTHTVPAEVVLQLSALLVN